MGYDNLSDEDKLDEAIRFIATGQPMPDSLTDFLHDVGLYDAVVRGNEASCHRNSLED